MASIDTMMYSALVSEDHDEKYVLRKMSEEFYSWIKLDNIPEDDNIMGKVVTSIAAISRIHEKDLCDSRLPKFCLDRLVRRDLDTYVMKFSYKIQDLTQNYCDNHIKRRKMNSIRENMVSAFSNKDKKMKAVRAMVDVISNY